LYQATNIENIRVFLLFSPPFIKNPTTSTCSVGFWIKGEKIIRPLNIIDDDLIDSSLIQKAKP